SEENGLFSRLFFYIIPETFQPYRMAIQQKDVIGDECRLLQQEILDLADPWTSEIQKLEFTQQQEEELCSAMRDKQQMEEKDGGSISASWFRMGIIVKRIAVTLAAFEKFSGPMPERPWRAAIAMLPTIKAHCIQALEIIRENQGWKCINWKKYDE